MAKKSSGEGIKCHGGVKLLPKEISKLKPLDTIEMTHAFLSEKELHDTTSDLWAKKKTSIHG